MKDETGIRKINLKDTLHVLELRTNLLSVSKITDNGFIIFSDRNKTVVRDKQGNEHLICRKQEGLYYVSENEEAAGSANETRQNSKLEIWHKRLEHLNEKSIKKIVSDEIINVQGITNKILGQCEICAKGKLTRKPFPNTSKRSSKMLEIIHTDLCGPMKTHSLGGARYFIVFIDDYSRWCEIRFLKSKNDVLDVFKAYKNLVENQTGCKIRALQSDNGTEFCNKEFQNFLDEHGIKRRLTTPYTPQQNGTAERKNRTLVETARCLLMDSNLPPSFWVEATATANHIRNRCISTSLEGKTPYELWNGR